MMNCVRDSLCYCVCVFVLGSLPLGLNRTVAAVPCRSELVIRWEGVVPVSHYGCPGLIAGKAVWDFGGQSGTVCLSVLGFCCYFSVAHTIILACDDVK
jgi:hypothetical protein